MLAVIYVRVSTEEQAEEGYSISAQERACRAYVEAQGWGVAGVHADEGLSGTLPADARPGLASALDLIRSGHAHAFVVHKLDRLARSVRITNELIEEFRRRNTAFVAVADRVDLSTPFGWASFQMQNVWNELYIKNLSFETSKGHREKAQKGLWVGPCPYGYERDGKTLRPSEDAAVVVRIFERYATGLASYTSIADELNAAGYRTFDWRTGERRMFGRESIRTILKNRAYCGYVSSGGREYPGVHPPLIPDALWSQANAVRQDRTDSSGVVKVNPVCPGLLTGIVRCAECGAPMWHHWAGRTGYRQRYYLCSGRSRRTCQAPYAHAEPIEEQMIEILSALTIPQDIEQAIAAEVERLLAAEMPRPRVDRGRIEEQQRRLAHLYADELIDDVEYAKRRDALRAQIVAAPDPVGVPDIAGALRLLSSVPALLEVATIDERRQLIRAVFSYVWAEGRKIAAVTPKGAYLPLLGILSKKGCPMGVNSPLFDVPLWSDYRVPC